VLAFLLFFEFIFRQRKTPTIDATNLGVVAGEQGRAPTNEF